jgi:hypothetical protein
MRDEGQQVRVVEQVLVVRVVRPAPEGVDEVERRMTADPFHRRHLPHPVTSFPSCSQ